MEKEIENLITENNELLATKNALNIVKDDLIAKVDELQSDLAMCKNEIQQREAVQERLKSRINQLDEELKKSKDDLEETKQKMSALKEVYHHVAWCTGLLSLPIYTYLIRTTKRAYPSLNANVSLELKCLAF